MSVYPYPPDEFDARPGAPIGAHRARQTGWGKAWPIVLVTALLASAAVAGLLLVRTHGGGLLANLPGGETAVATGDVQEPPAYPGALPPGVEDHETGAPVEDIEYTPDASVAALLADADLAASIRVLNDRAPDGTATIGQQILHENGFTQVTAETFPGISNAEANSVWYRDGYRPTALAVAAIFEIPEGYINQQVLRTGDIMFVIREPLHVPTAEETEDAQD